LSKNGQKLVDFEA